MSSSLEGKIGSSGELDADDVIVIPGPPTATLLSSSKISSSSSSSDISSVDPLQDSTSATLDTLDEPVSETIMRDVRSVAYKMKLVLMPATNASSSSSSAASTLDAQMRDWDLYGPLILCLALALSLTLGGNTSSDQSASFFAGIFVIVWMGAGIVTVNATLLGGSLSFLQSVCVLGYCIAPLSVISLITHLLIPSALWFLSWILVFGAFLWSTRASLAFISVLVPSEKRALALYPLFLFYTTIAWLILATNAK